MQQIRNASYLFSFPGNVSVVSLADTYKSGIAAPVGSCIMDPSVEATSMMPDLRTRIAPRVQPELHHQVRQAAQASGLSLNTFCVQALKAAVAKAQQKAA